MKFSAAFIATIVGLLSSTTQANRFLRGDRELKKKTCTALVAYVEFEGLDLNEPSLHCEVEGGAVLSVNSSKMPPGQIKKLLKEKKIVSGVSKIDIDGKKTDKGSVDFGDDDVAFDNAGGGRERRLATVEGTRSVLAVRVLATDESPSYDEATLSNSVFGDNGDPLNLKSQYSACSNGKLNFVPANSKSLLSGQGQDGETDISNGVTTVRVNVDTSQGDGIMRNDVTEELKNNFGVSHPTNLANHVMYCLPPSAMSGIAYAYVNSWMSVYKDKWCTYVSGQMHELGHNLNLAHSNEEGTYKDQSGMMGYSYSGSDSPRMCFNGAKMYQLGWLDDASVDFQVGTDTNQMYEMKGIADTDWGYTNSFDGHPRVVKINTPSATDYYVTYNLKRGVNSGTVEGGNTVTIVSAGGEGSSYAASELEAKLTASSSPYVVPGTNVQVDVVSLDSSSDSGMAMVCISEDGVSCSSSPATTTTTPATTTTQPTTTTTTSTTTTTQGTTTTTTQGTTTTTQATTTTTTNPPPFSCSNIGGGGTCKKDNRCYWSKGRCYAK